MKAYLKRAKGSWQQGKGCKAESSSAERRYSMKEIQEQLNHDEDTYLERHHKGARTKNVEARLKYRISWYEQYVADWDNRGTSSPMMSYFRGRLEAAKKELKNYLDKKGQVS